jgi:hypothetical protein
MDIIQLPAVPLLTPLKAALSIMRASHRSAVVTEAAAGTLVVSARDVRLGINRQKKTLQDLEGMETIPFERVLLPAETRLPPMGVKHRRLNMVALDTAAFDRILSGTQGHYALIGHIVGTAYILTRFETRAELYAEPPKQCACGNPNYLHEYDEADNVSTGQTCQFCPFTITC